jgi:hypothetical protein
VNSVDDGTDPERPSALELQATLARSALLAGEPETAIGALETIMRTPKWELELPRDVIMLEMGRARVAHAANCRPEDADEQLRAAASVLQRGIKAKPNRFVAPMKLLRAEALSKVSGGDQERARRKAGAVAVAALDEVIQSYPKHVDTGRHMLEYARALERAGRIDDSAAAYRQVVITRGEEQVARDAWSELERLDANSKISLRELTRGERLEQASAARDLYMYEFSLRVVEGVMSEKMPELQRNKAQYSRAWSRYKTRDYDGCVADMEELQAKAPTAQHAEHLIRCLRYGGRYAEAVDFHEGVARRTKNKAAKEKAHWQAINLAARGGLYGRAQELLDAYEKKYKANAERRRWLRAWLPHRLGDDRKALAAFEEVAGRSKDERSRAAKYYRGRILMASEDSSERAEGIAELNGLVEEAWEALESHRVAPGFRIYYGLMARERLLAAEQPVPEPPEIQAMPLGERWFGFAETRREFEAVLGELEGSSPTLERADALHRIGYLDEARREFRVASYELVNGMRKRDRLSIKMPRTEAVEVGLSWKPEMEYPKPLPSKAGQSRLRDEEKSDRWQAGMRRLAAAIGEPYFVARFSPRADHAYSERFYLRAYREAVEHTAAARSIDPFHIWALMYTESRFRRYVLSYVGARGAMQIYPPSLRRRLVLAGEFDGRLDVDGLFQIETALASSLRTGKELLAEFDGHHALLYGSYNGGGHNIRRWLWAKQSGGELQLDDFIEEIGFRETRRYVRRVMSVYVGYNLLYGQGVPRIRTDLDGIFTKDKPSMDG